jgi:phenylpropionate dioxygenase-like ring-hydroxylating dioxygenase large terminal subunit
MSDVQSTETPHGQPSRTKPTFAEAQNRRQKARAAGLDPNYWYAVEHDSALKKGAVQEVKFWGQSVALYRDDNGRLHAIENRCAHRQLKLTGGVVSGDRLVCGYHAWEYNGCGELVAVGHSLFGKSIPKCKLRHYPVKVRYGLIWIFFGDPERATETKMPEIPELEGENRWECVPVDFTWGAHHSMIIDNVSDFTHAYLHRKYKPFSDAVLTKLETIGDRVELCYDTKVGGGAISGRFVDKKNVDMNAMTLAFDYPYQRSDTDGKIKHWCFVLPIDEQTTRTFFLFYFDCFIVPFTKVKIPRRLMKPFLQISNELLIKPLLREDGVAVEAEQAGYEKHWDQPVFDLNPAVLAFQAVIVRKWEAHLAATAESEKGGRLSQIRRREPRDADSAQS